MEPAEPSADDDVIDSILGTKRNLKKVLGLGFTGMVPLVGTEVYESIKLVFVVCALVCMIAV